MIKTNHGIKTWLRESWADTRYLGESGFPVVIEASVFLEVEEKRKKKAPAVQKTEAQTVLRRKCGCRITPYIEHEVLYLLNTHCRPSGADCNPKSFRCPVTTAGHAEGRIGGPDYAAARG